MACGFENFNNRGDNEVVGVTNEEGVGESVGGARSGRSSKRQNAGPEWSSITIFETGFPEAWMVTLFVVERWDGLSRGMPDLALILEVLERLKQGFRLRFRGDIEQPRPARRNNPSAYRNKQVVSEYKNGWP